MSECSAVPEGAGFTEKLNRAAFTAGGLIAAGRLDEREARALLAEAAQQARPWHMPRNERIIDNGLAAGFDRPLRARDGRGDTGIPSDRP
ncbi:hypothetical protein [Streptomyces zhihengii]|uniref:hypothetical protein n=1 Tax=Streptomyces zhihengii TaxID=1818004 RepID=UPI0033AD9E22